MADPILAARLAALERNLRRAERGPSWWDSVPWQLEDAVRERLDRAIRDQAIEYLEALDEIQERLKRAKQTGDASVRQHLLEEAWRQYTEVYEQCQVFFGECLEIIGGLTFRGSGLEDRIYQVADELIKNCAKASSGMRTLAPIVPALPKTLIRTLARIVGLRFPEWTIWSLPFTAHELGHIIVRDERTLKRFVDEQTQKWANGNAKKRVESHLLEFLADAFATYTMGPAYACATILLKFNPSVAYTDDDDLPADARRAHIVLTMLRRMNDAAGIEEPYKGVITRLWEEWQAMLRRAGQPDALETANAQRLDELIDATWDKFKNGLLPTARYLHDEEAYGWPVAQKWHRVWRSRLAKEQSLGTPDASRRNTLRDVLNAAWLCRLEYPDEAERIAEAAHRLCKAVSEERKKASGTHKAGRVGTSTSFAHRLESVPLVADARLKSALDQDELIIALRDALVKYFSESELNDLCLDLKVDYGEIRRENKRSTIVELVGYFKRRGRLNDLVENIKKERPRADLGHVL